MVHDLNSLEKEILRLQLQQKDNIHKLDKQWDKARHHFGAILLNSFRRRKEEREEGPGFFENILRNEKVEETLRTVAEKISGRLAEVVSALLDKFLKK